MATKNNDKVVDIDDFKDDDELAPSTYMFHNKKFQIQLFVQACGFDDAATKFELCGFENISEWEVYLKTRYQPSSLPNKKNAN